MTYIFSVEFFFTAGEMIALSPKCYFAYNADNQETKCGHKGVPSSAKLQLEEYKNKLYDNDTPRVEVRSLRYVDGHMTRVCQTKKGLNSLFCKYRIDSDGVTCRPLMENNQFL